VIDPNLVINVHASGFREEAKRQSLAVALADRQDDVMEFIEATYDMNEAEEIG
jgi:hypothetical protein